MSDETRKKILEALDCILQEQPDMRFGQLVTNLAVFARGPFKSAAYDVEDEELLTAATRHLQNLQKHREAEAQVKEMAAAMRAKTAA